MPYARTHVRQALSAAREAGKPVDGLIAGDRETAIMLEKWGFLPIDQEATDRRIADWYAANGLAVKVADTPEPVHDTPRDTPEPPPADTPGDTPERSRVALEAAEAALAAASAAIRLARLSA